MKSSSQILVIDTGLSALKMAVLEISGSKLKLLQTKLVEFPDPLPQKNDDLIKSSILEFTSGSPALKQAYIVLPDPKINIARIELPSMPAEEVPAALSWKIKDRISFDPSDAIIDSYISDEIKAEDGNKYLVIIAAAAEKVSINHVISFAKELHLNLTAISAVPFGLANIIKKTKGIKSNEVTACVNFGARYTSVSVFKSSNLVFTRDIPVSSSGITESMCGTLISDKGRFELSYTEAEALKKQFGIPFSGQETLAGEYPASQITSLIRPVLEQLSLEIKRTFTYYISQLNGTNPDKIFLTGGGAKLKNIDVFLKNELKMPVEFLKLPSCIENRTDEDEKSILSFLGPIGTAIPFPAKEINLLPPELRVTKVETIQKISIRMLGFTMLCIFALLYFIINFRVSILKKQIENAKSHQKIVQKVIDLYNELLQWDNAANQLTARKFDGELLLKKVSSIIPENIVLENLSADLKENKVILKGIFLQDNVSAEDKLTGFMEDLEDSGYFKEANLSSIKKTQEGNKVIANFEIECLLN